MQLQTVSTMAKQYSLNPTIGTACNHLSLPDYRIKLLRIAIAVRKRLGSLSRVVVPGDYIPKETPRRVSYLQRVGRRFRNLLRWEKFAAMARWCDSWHTRLKLLWDISGFTFIRAVTVFNYIFIYLITC